MTEGKISRQVVSDRMHWVQRMLEEIRQLSLTDAEEFFNDARNVWAAESCLRRVLEALLDLGRHILAKGFALGVSEYKDIARKLKEKGVLGAKEGRLLETFAGYRNRLVHFYHDVSREEIFGICKDSLTNVELVLEAVKQWLHDNAQRLDDRLWIRSATIPVFVGSCRVVL